MLDQSQLIESVGWACAGCGDETRRIYDTVCVEVDERGVATAAATNGHRLAAVSGYTTDAKPGLYSARTGAPNASRTSAPYPAPYPNWRTIRPRGECATLHLAPTAILPALTRAVLGRRGISSCGEFCSGGFVFPSSARFESDGKSLAIDFLEVEPPHTLRLPLLSSAPPSQFSANPLYLLEALAAIRAVGHTRAELQVREPTDPLVLRGDVAQAIDTPDYTCFIMCVRDWRDEED